MKESKLPSFRIISLILAALLVLPTLHADSFEKDLLKNLPVYAADEIPQNTTDIIEEAPKTISAESSEGKSAPPENGASAAPDTAETCTVIPALPISAPFNKTSPVSGNSMPVEVFADTPGDETTTSSSAVSGDPTEDNTTTTDSAVSGDPTGDNTTTTDSAVSGDPTEDNTTTTDGAVSGNPTEDATTDGAVLVETTTTAIIVPTASGIVADVGDDWEAFKSAYTEGDDQAIRFTVIDASDTGSIQSSSAGDKTLHGTALTLNGATLDIGRRVIVSGGTTLAIPDGINVVNGELVVQSGATVDAMVYIGNSARLYVSGTVSTVVTSHVAPAAVVLIDDGAQVASLTTDAGEVTVSGGTVDNWIVYAGHGDDQSGRSGCLANLKTGNASIGRIDLTRDGSCITLIPDSTVPSDRIDVDVTGRSIGDMLFDGDTNDIGTDIIAGLLTKIVITGSADGVKVSGSSIFIADAPLDVTVTNHGRDVKDTLKTTVSGEPENWTVTLTAPVGAEFVSDAAIEDALDISVTVSQAAKDMEREADYTRLSDDNSLMVSAGASERGNASINVPMDEPTSPASAHSVSITDSGVEFHDQRGQGRDINNSVPMDYSITRVDNTTLTIAGSGSDTIAIALNQPLLAFSAGQAELRSIPAYSTRDTVGVLNILTLVDTAASGTVEVGSFSYDTTGGNVQPRATVSAGAFNMPGAKHGFWTMDEFASAEADHDYKITGATFTYGGISTTVTFSHNTATTPAILPYDNITSPVLTGASISNTGTVFNYKGLKNERTTTSDAGWTLLLKQGAGTVANDPPPGIMNWVTTKIVPNTEFSHVLFTIQNTTNDTVSNLKVAMHADIYIHSDPQAPVEPIIDGSDVLGFTMKCANGCGMTLALINRYKEGDTLLSHSWWGYYPDRLLPENLWTSSSTRTSIPNHTIDSGVVANVTGIRLAPGEIKTIPFYMGTGAESKIIQDLSDVVTDAKSSDPPPPPAPPPPTPPKRSTSYEYYGDVENPVTPSTVSAAYVFGVGNNRFEPNRDMTRAETVQVFYNLLTDKNVEFIAKFMDVPADAWYATAVNAMAGLGVISDSGDGLFRPNDPITKEQFAAISERFANIAQTSFHFDDDSIFSDSNGFIERSAAVTIMNQMLDRLPDTRRFDTNGNFTRFTDVDQSHWAYYDILEAANARE